MDYRNFSADALSSALADFEKLSEAKIETIGKIEKAQVQVLKQFDHFFPSRIEAKKHLETFETRWGWIGNK